MKQRLTYYMKKVHPEDKDLLFLNIKKGKFMHGGKYGTSNNSPTHLNASLKTKASSGFDTAV